VIEFLILNGANVNAIDRSALLPAAFLCEVNSLLYSKLLARI
jgi:hypothetical protein